MSAAEINQKKNGAPPPAKNAATPLTNTKEATHMNVIDSMAQSDVIANANGTMLSAEEAIKLATAPDIERHEPGPEWASVVPPYTASPVWPTDFTRIVEHEIGQVAGVRVSISQFQTIDEGVRGDGEPMITISADCKSLTFSEGHALLGFMIAAQKKLGEITGTITAAVTQ
ncbi:hypothetical protein DMH04_41450 [Kibdelosporangium aridum]|uniref:Uncharacterized protein n=1 Tax=Kibdelosporangium aridum TaxID=2030 RepID=A0A428YUT5_KIBAR|nr:hypothetical protein [Kibdelosporangium aridum]RSM73480.1 hypothetical protein DMH04_41450 [Kibdelosporangium aridum]